MSKIEEELRAAFARHEADTPASGPVRAGIDVAWVRAKRRRAWQRVAGAAAAVVLAGVGVPVVAGRFGHGPVPSVLPGASSAAGLDGPVDVLLLGNDSKLADTVMLLHVTADRKQVYLVSLPRTGVLPSGERLNATLLRGASATRDAVRSLTGVEIDATVTVGLPALTAVTGAVGGVTVCVEQGIVAHSKRKAIPVGCQMIGPDEVGPLLRGRYQLRNGSYDRDAHNRSFLRSLSQKVMADGIDLGELQGLLAAAKDGITVDGDRLGLLRLAASLDRPKLVGIGARSAAGGPEGSLTEAIYPQAGAGLFAAIQADRVDEWAAANPDLVDG